MNYGKKKYVHTSTINWPLIVMDNYFWKTQIFFKRWIIQFVFYCLNVLIKCMWKPIPVHYLIDWLGQRRNSILKYYYNVAMLRLSAAIFWEMSYMRLQGNLVKERYIVSIIISYRVSRSCQVNYNFLASKRKQFRFPPISSMYDTCFLKKTLKMYVHVYAYNYLSNY